MAQNLQDRPRYCNGMEEAPNASAEGMSAQEAPPPLPTQAPATIKASPPLQVHRQELREILDDWAQVFLQALNGSRLCGPDSDGSDARVCGPDSERSDGRTGQCPLMQTFVPPARGRTSSTSIASGGQKSVSTFGPLLTSHEDTRHIQVVADLAIAREVTFKGSARESGTSLTSDSYSSVGVSQSAAVVEHMVHQVTRPWKTKRMHQTVLGPNGLRPSVRANNSNKTKYAWRRKFIALVDSQFCEWLCAFAILANACLIGWLSDYRSKHAGHSTPAWALYCEFGFCAFFVLEVGLKLLAHGVFFFYSEHWRWNLFDLSLVAHAVAEILANAASDATHTNSSVVRVLRLTKMLRILRIIRYMRGFRELRLITNCLMGSAGAMFWSSVLLWFVTYVFGVVFLQYSALSLQSSILSAEDKELLREHWGSIFTCMLSLFMATTGGEDWRLSAAPLKRVSSEMYFFFLVYIAFFLFAVTNAITSLFIEATMKFSAQDNVMAIHLELEKKDKHIKNLQEFFEEVDFDGDGLISYDDFSATIYDPRLQAFASSLGIDVYDTLAFFKTLSGHDIRSGSSSKLIDLETFVIGCIKLRGEAKAVDMYNLFDQQQELTTQVRMQMSQIDKQLSEIKMITRATSTSGWRRSTESVGWRGTADPELNEGGTAGTVTFPPRI